jgi:RNA polymerase sigma-70 factor (ECF subfamily)
MAFNASMDSIATDDAFAPLRAKLFRVAYRMLGSVADAEDVLQEAFLRWHDTDRAAVVGQEAFLRMVVTRLCLDHLKSARHRREVYVGSWLPDPIVEAEEGVSDEVTLPLLLPLDRLSPLERAAFLLHDVFGVSFEEIAETLDRDAGACRQLARRARTNVRAARPRFPVPRQRGLEIAAAFFEASRGGDLARLRSLLSEDVVVVSDGGGKASSLEHPVRGLENAIRLFESLALVFVASMSRLARIAFVNGLPGFVTIESGLVQTTALEIENGRVVGVYVVRNPDKVEHLRSPDL